MEHLSSLQRGLLLLDAFSSNDRDVTMGELARRTELPKTTVHRLVTDLVRGRMLERTAQGFRLGGKLFELGNLVPAQRQLREHALPFVHRLSEATHLTANVAVGDGAEIVYLEKVITRGVRVPHTRIGGRLPAHCTALGKAILAFSSPELVEDVLSHPLARMSRRTVTEAGALRRELDSVRRTSLAYDVEESQEALFCVAAPVLGAGREVLGAISLTGAAGPAAARSYGSLVVSAALALSRELGLVRRAV